MWTKTAVVALFISWTMGSTAARLRALGGIDSSLTWVDWWSKGRGLARAGDCSGASNAFRRALTLAQNLAVEPRQLAGIYDAFGSAEADLGNFIESGRAYERGLALLGQSEGRGSVSYALLFGDFAMLPTQRNRVGEATELLRVALETAGPDAHATDFVTCRHTLVYLLMSQGRYSEAEPVARTSLAVVERYEAGDVRSRADCLDELGVIRLYRGQYRDAVDLLRESLRLFISSSNSGYPHLVTILNNLATAYTKSQNFPEAEAAYRQALSFCETSMGKNHPTYGLLLENYSVILRKVGRKREARTIAAQSREVARSSSRRNGIGMTVDVKALR